MTTMVHGEIRRIIYTSRAVASDLIGTLSVSRANNGLDGITGLLLARAGQYVQVLEGPPQSVSDTFSRIRRDSRHSDITILADTLEKERIFADWAMAGLPGENERLCTTVLRYFFGMHHGRYRSPSGRRTLLRNWGDELSGQATSNDPQINRPKH